MLHTSGHFSELEESNGLAPATAPARSPSGDAYHQRAPALKYNSPDFSYLGSCNLYDESPLQEPLHHPLPFCDPLGL